MADNLHQDDSRWHLRTLTMGNPMVDLILHVSKEFIEEQGLIHGESIHGHVSTETRQKLFDFVLASPHAIRSMGGSALNSARTVQIFLPPLASIFVGAIGDDSNGRFLQQTAFEQGVDMRVQILPEFSTSTCLCFITPDFERTLVVQRSAHAEYSLDSTFQAVVGQVDIVYIVSFALSTLSRFACAQFAATQRRSHQVMCLNLSSANVFANTEMTGRLVSLFPSCQLLFGNAAEYEALANALNISMDVPAFAKWLIETHLQPQAVVVITSGNAPTLVIQAKSCLSFPVSIPDDFLVQDTNGAGDAFVGGFLAAMMRFCCLESCVELAHLCAVQCVQEVGAHVHLNDNLMNKAHTILSTSKRESSLYLALIKQSSSGPGFLDISTV